MIASTDSSIPCLVSSDFAATATFYRVFGFDVVALDEAMLRLRCEGIDLIFTRRAEPLAWDDDRLAAIMVADVSAWRGKFAATQVRWDPMGRPGADDDQQRRLGRPGVQPVRS
jgi:hypothetical protein